MMPSKGNQALTRKMKSILVLSANQPKKAEPIRPTRTSSQRKCPKSSPLSPASIRGINQNGRESRSDNQPGYHRYRNGPEQTDVRQNERKGSRTENGAPYHILTPESVAQHSTEQSPDSQCRQKGEQTDLGMLYGHTELVHQEEREIARHARDIKVFREYQHDKNQKRRPDRLFDSPPATAETA